MQSISLGMTTRAKQVIGSVAAALFAMGLAVLPGVFVQWHGIISVVCIGLAALLGFSLLFLPRDDARLEPEPDPVPLGATIDQEKVMSKEMGNGDSYNNFGHNYGHMGPINVGKLPFELTNEVLLKVLSLPKKSPITIQWIGSQRSARIAHSLAAEMAKEGFQIKEITGVGMRIPPMEQPLTFDGATLYVDADK